MPFNFQSPPADWPHREYAHAVYDCIKDRKNVGKPMRAFWLSLSNDYFHVRFDNFSIDQAKARVEEVFSEFLQHMIHYAYGTIKSVDDVEWVQGLIGYLLSLSFFHIKSNFNKDFPRVVHWKDPENDMTVLMNLSSIGSLDQIRLHLTRFAKLYEGEAQIGFQDYIASVDQPKKRSALYFLCEAGYIAGVTYLLEVAEKAYGGKNTDGFRAFISNVDVNHNSVLHAAVKHPAMLEVLFKAAALAFGGVKTNGYQQFISPENNVKDSPLNAAVVIRNLPSVGAIIQEASVAYENADFKKFINHIGEHGSPLTLAHAQKYDSIISLLELYHAQFNIKKEIKGQAVGKALTLKMLPPSSSSLLANSMQKVLAPERASSENKRKPDNGLDVDVTEHNKRRVTV